MLRGRRLLMLLGAPPRRLWSSGSRSSSCCYVALTLAAALGAAVAACRDRRAALARLPDPPRASSPSPSSSFSVPGRRPVLASSPAPSSHAAAVAAALCALPHQRRVLSLLAVPGVALTPLAPLPAPSTPMSAGHAPQISSIALRGSPRCLRASEGVIKGPRQSADCLSNKQGRDGSPVNAPAPGNRLGRLSQRRQGSLCRPAGSSPLPETNRTATY